MPFSKTYMRTPHLVKPSQGSTSYASAPRLIQLYPHCDPRKARLAVAAQPNTACSDMCRALRVRTSPARTHGCAMRHNAACCRTLATECGTLVLMIWRVLIQAKPNRARPAQRELIPHIKQRCAVPLESARADGIRAYCNSLMCSICHHAAHVEQRKRTPRYSLQHRRRQSRQRTCK